MQATVSICFGFVVRQFSFSFRCEAVKVWIQNTNVPKFDSFILRYRFLHLRVGVCVSDDSYFLRLHRWHHYFINDSTLGNDHSRSVQAEL